MWQKSISRKINKTAVQVYVNSAHSSLLAHHYHKTFNTFYNKTSNFNKTQS